MQAPPAPSFKSYTYNAWGEILSATGDMADINPLRYRGYYFDSDTGLYYLKARYYDLQLCRFINADGADMLGINCDATSYNLFAYCGNNPIARKDDGGYIWNFVAGAVVGAASVYVGDVIGNVIRGRKGLDIFKPTSSVGTYFGAAVSGMIPGVGLANTVTRAAASTGVKYVTDFVVNDQPIKVSNVVKSFLASTAGDVLSSNVTRFLNKLRPANYSIFKHQITRYLPEITQEQTKQVMYTINRGINHAISAFNFFSNVILNR